MDLFRGYSPDQLALVDQLRQAARRQAAIEQASDAAAESARRLQALQPSRRFYVNCLARFWSTAAWVLFAVSKWLPPLKAAAISAGRRVLQPPSLYPEVAHDSANKAARAMDDSSRRASAFRAVAEEIGTLPASDGGRLSVETTLQVEELARRVEFGADEAHIRDAMRRIREGESLVETLKRGL